MQRTQANKRLTVTICPTPDPNRCPQAGLWNDPDAYFSHPGGFVAFDPDVPQSLLDAAAVTFRDRTWDKYISPNATQPHFNLVNHQLQQVRGCVCLVRGAFHQ